MRKLKYHERKLLKKVDFLQARGGRGRLRGGFNPRGQ